MHRKQGMQMTDNGGKEIQVILESAANTAEAFDGYDQLSKNPSDPFESAFYKRRYYAVPIVLSDTENWENGGSAKVFDLLNALGNNSQQSLAKAVNEDLLGAQTGKTMLGYQDIMADATGATVGGINSTTSTFWESQRDTTATTFLSQTTTNVFDGIDLWNDIMDTCQIQGGLSKGAIVTTHSIARAYRIAVSSQGYAETSLANASGVGGKMLPSFYHLPVVADNDVSADHSYFVDTNAVKLNVLRQANFRKTPFQSMIVNGQFAQIAYVYVSVQLTTNNRRRSGVATAITGA